MLVAKSGGRVTAKLIDFGLAVEQRLKEDAVRASLNGNSLHAQTTVGTLDYAAPEQLGKLRGAKPGPYSDVYGFAKTCCFVLFRRTQPTPKHWKQVPDALAELLGQCLEEDPADRFQDFGAVFAAWAELRAPSAPPSPSPAGSAEPRAKEAAAEVPAPAPPAARVAATPKAPAAPDADAPPRFPGLELLRKNQFGLFDYWHAASGERPTSTGNGPFVIGDDTGLVFTLIPGGTYTIGAQKSDPKRPHFDPGAFDDESPVHDVALAPYLIAKYAMTRGQWQRLAGAGPSANVNQPAQRERALAYPVENVSWEDCSALLTHVGLAPPTEAQWEAAARARTTTPWWCGPTEHALKGKIAFNEGEKAKTVPVDAFGSNPFELFNILGNVWVWCEDGYSDSAYKNVRPRAGDGLREVFGASSRVIRGGSTWDGARYARAAGRFRDSPGSRSVSLGVRPVLTL